MNNIEMARSYLEEAGRRIRTSENALNEDAYAYCIRQCQEAVELSLKAALRFIAIEPPKWHDVSPILTDNMDRFPEWFREKIDEISASSRWLYRERAPSMYGDEESGLPPQKLYTRSYAERALEEAKNVFEMVSMIIGGEQR